MKHYYVALPYIYTVYMCMCAMYVSIIFLIICLLRADMTKLAEELGVTTVYLEKVISPIDFTEINEKYNKDEIMGILEVSSYHPQQRLLCLVVDICINMLVLYSEIVIYVCVYMYVGIYI